MSMSARKRNAHSVASLANGRIWAYGYLSYRARVNFATLVVSYNFVHEIQKLPVVPPRVVAGLEHPEVVSRAPCAGLNSVGTMNARFRKAGENCLTVSHSQRFRTFSVVRTAGSGLVFLFEAL
jgi:hypothetical protein